VFLVRVALVFLTANRAFLFYISTACASTTYGLFLWDLLLVRARITTLRYEHSAPEILSLYLRLNHGDKQSEVSLLLRHNPLSGIWEWVRKCIYWLESAVALSTVASLMCQEVWCAHGSNQQSYSSRLYYVDNAVHYLKSSMAGPSSLHHHLIRAQS